MQWFITRHVRQEYVPKKSLTYDAVKDANEFEQTNKIVPSKHMYTGLLSDLFV